MRGFFDFRSIPWLRWSVVGVSLLAVLIGPSTVLAQQEDFGELQQLLETNVESATKTDVSVQNTPQEITVVDREQVLNSGADNLGELIRSVTSVNTLKIQSSQNQISVRGNNVWTPSKTLLLVDGEPIETTVFSTTWWDLVPVSVKDVQRVEVIKSPGTIYGRNAQHGVINIVTRSTEDIEAGKSYEVTSHISGGEQSYQAGHVGVRTALTDQTDFSLSVESKSFDAYEGDPEDVAGIGTTSGEQKFGFDEEMMNSINVHSSLDHNLENGSVEVDFANRSFDPVRGRVPDRLCFVGMEGYSRYANSNYEFDAFNVENELSVGFNENNFRFNQNGNPCDIDSTTGETDRLGNEMTLSTYNLGYEVQSDFGAENQHNILFGIDLTLESGSEDATSGNDQFFPSDDYVDNEEIISAYIQDEWTLNEKNTAYLGGIFTDHYVAGANFAPMAALVHSYSDETTIRAGSFTSYRNGNVFEHSMDFVQREGDADKRTEILTNQDLDASRTTSYEVGLRSQVEQDLYLETNLYHLDVSDAMEWDLEGTSTFTNDAGNTQVIPQYKTENNLESSYYGGNILARFTPSDRTNWVNSVSFNTLDNSSSDPDYTDDGFGEGRYGDEYVPPIIFNSTVNYDYSNFTGQLAFEYVAEHDWYWPGYDDPAVLGGSGTESRSRKPVPGYSTVNGSIGYEVNDRYRVSVEGYNLLDNAHTEWRGDKGHTGRMVWGTVSAKF